MYYSVERTIYFSAAGKRKTRKREIQSERRFCNAKCKYLGYGFSESELVKPDSSSKLVHQSRQRGGGFWEEPVSKAGNPPPLQKLPMMQKATIVPTSKPSAQPPQLSPQQQQNNKSGKSKSKKEEELVKKLFEQNTAKTDDFTQWCAKALSGLQVSVDSQYRFFFLF